MNTLALIPGMSGGPEILLIFAVILLLFGGKKLPGLARSLGKSLGEFKKGQREGNLPDSAEPEDAQKEISSSDEASDDETAS